MSRNGIRPEDDGGRRGGSDLVRVLIENHTELEIDFTVTITDNPDDGTTRVLVTIDDGRKAVS